MILPIPRRRASTAPDEREEPTSHCVPRADIAVLASVSLLLGYPDQALYERLGYMAEVARHATSSSATCLERLVDRFREKGPSAMAAEYVETFDLRRRCCLYLTYYTHGDTRNRGMALVAFAEAYRQAGYQPPSDELPDHLAVACNFAALAPESGLRLLREHQAGVEALRMALGQAGSDYVDVIDALRGVLPEPNEGHLSRALDLLRVGPPTEQVGLEPFAPPEYMGGHRR